MGHRNTLDTTYIILSRRDTTPTLISGPFCAYKRVFDEVEQRMALYEARENYKMTKTILAGSLALLLTTTASATEVKKVTSMPKLDLAIVSDTEYNTELETTETEFGAEVGFKNFTATALPNWSWDDTEMNNLQFGLRYDWKIEDKITISPYGEVNLDNDLEEKNKIIGLKTRMSF